MKKSKFSDSQIMAILKQHEAGIKVPDLCREHGMSSATFYKWRSKYGVMGVPKISPIKELEAENICLEKMCTESKMNNELLSEMLQNKAIKLLERKSLVRWLVIEKKITVQHACRLVAISRSCYNNWKL